MGAEELQALATAAVDAATHAGASYADIRIAERHLLSVREVFDPNLNPNVRIDSTIAYGVRTLVDGIWAFQHGTVPSLDAVTGSARQAVATARNYKGLTKQLVELTPSPAATGTWTTPIQIDPFTVPIEEQYSRLVALGMATGRTPGASYTARGMDGISFTWTREHRVFASSQGSLTRQTFYRAVPDVVIAAFRGLSYGRTGLPMEQSWLPNFGPVSAGYEAVLVPSLQDDFKALGEEAVRLASLPRRVFEVGRYPVVMDGGTIGALMSHAIGSAMELDRVLGNESGDATGTFLSPPESILGTPVFSPLVNVRASRALPTLLAAQWDDEGVVPEDYTVVKDGRVVDYHTHRDSAPALRDWYAQRQQPLRSHGCAVALDADQPVSVRAPHLTMTAGDASLDALIGGISRGLLVLTTGRVSMVQQMAGGSMGRAILYEIERGRVVRRAVDAGLQFSTRTLWKNLTVLGDRSTVQTRYTELVKGQPWIPMPHGTTAPAGFFKECDVIALT